MAEVPPQRSEASQASRLRPAKPTAAPSGPTPRIGRISPAQDTSLPGSSQVSAAEKAMEKKITVSSVEPSRVEISGAFHQELRRNRSKTVTSSICAVRKARPDPSATRKRDQRTELARDLRPDQRTDDTGGEPRPDHAPRCDRPMQPVRQVGHEEGQRIGEGPPGQPLAEQVLHQDVGKRRRWQPSRGWRAEASGSWVWSVLTRLRKLGPGWGAVPLRRPHCKVNPARETPPPRCPGRARSCRPRSSSSAARPPRPARPRCPRDCQTCRAASRAASRPQ